MKKPKKIILISVTSIIMVLLALSTFDTSTLYPAYEDTIIANFNNNRDDFEAIRRYAEETEGPLSVSVDTRLFGKVHFYESIKSVEINQKIDRLVSKLHYQSIQEAESEFILFIRIADNDECGIAYCPDEQLPFFTVVDEELGDGWYYYETFHE